MKAKKIIFCILAVFVLAAFLFSCQSIRQNLGTISTIGAGTLQAFGVIDARTANALAKSGVAWERAFEEITPEQEYYIGRAVAASILTTYRLETNMPEMTAYLNKICMALVVNSARPEIFNGYSVAILATDEINAFATPGGHIFLTRGLIELAPSEDALAAVIAHELAHIQLEHGLLAIRNNRRTQAGMQTVFSVGAAAAGSAELDQIVGIFGESVNVVVESLVTNGFSRRQEEDADSLAMALMALAGYEPSALIEMLQVLEKHQAGRPGGFNRTHPTPAQRIANAQRTVNNHNVPDTRAFRQARFAAFN